MRLERIVDRVGVDRGQAKSCSSSSTRHATSPTSAIEEEPTMLLLFARSCFKASDGASVHADSYNHEVRAMPFFGKWCGGSSGGVADPPPPPISVMASSKGG